MHSATTGRAGLVAEIAPQPSNEKNHGPTLPHEPPCTKSSAGTVVGVTDTDADRTQYPGESIGLPAKGRGSLAPWLARVGALIGDWAASMVVAIAIFGLDVMTGSGWKSFMILAVFFVEASVLTIFTGGSFGQLIARIGVVRLDGRPLGWWRPVVRTALKCLVIPALVVGAERRALTDLVLGTVVVNRR